MREELTKERRLWTVLSLNKVRSEALVLRRLSAISLLEDRKALEMMMMQRLKMVTELPTLTRVSMSVAVNASPVSRSVTKFSYVMELVVSLSTANLRMAPEL